VAADDGRTLALPFDHDTVPTVDLAAGRLVVEPPPELLPAERPDRRRHDGAQAPR
jgi:ribosomal 30S subunit maturation factor RimM